MQRTIFSEAGQCVANALRVEGISCSELFLQNFLRLLSKTINYQEEEIKVRPEIMLGHDIEQIVSIDPTTEVVHIGVGQPTGEDMMRYLKPIIPFCNNGWTVYINLHDDSVDYGILRGFNELTSLSLSDLLYEEDPDGMAVEDPGMLYFTVGGGTEIIMKGLINRPQIIDLSFSQEEVASSHEGSILKLSDAMVAGIEASDSNELKRAFLKLLRLTLQKVHGTICVVIKNEVDVDQIELFRNDSLVLGTPIDLVELAREAMNAGTSQSVRKYYAMSGLLLEMMNIDGICLVDNAGRIRAFNVFIKRDGIASHGGARRRAFRAIIESNDENVVGVYFQSQDGYSEFEGMGR